MSHRHVVQDATLSCSRRSGRWSGFPGRSCADGDDGADIDQRARARLASRADVAAVRSDNSFARRASRRRMVFASRDCAMESSSSSAFSFAKNGVWIWLKASSAFWREILYFSVKGVPMMMPGERAKNKRPGNLPGLDWVGVLPAVPVHPWSKGSTDP